MTRVRRTIRGSSYLLAIVTLISTTVGWSGAAEQKPIAVRLKRTSQGYQLLRDGKPYFIRGAGGDGSLVLLAKAGGNSIRTWGADHLEAKLDEAHRLGLTVAVGIWLGHERHGFNYNNADQVAAQYEETRRIIERYKNHPAILLWGLGNEMLDKVRLSDDWKQYSIDVSGGDLSRIVTAFAWVVAGQGKPVTFYIDDVRYE